MTEAEIDRALREKWASPLRRRIARKSKLKMRFGKRLLAEIRSTREKLDLLLELRTAQEQEIINRVEGD